MDALALIEKYYDPHSRAYQILVTHSELVTQKALRLAERVADLQPDYRFIEEAGMLHDIGMFMTNAPGLDCHGMHPYICHGFLGRELLEKESLPCHALVCERHTGAGITREDIRKQNLPLPERDMVPESLEEKIICFADKFYSKNPDRLTNELTLAEIRNRLARFGTDKVAQIDEWARLFGIAG